MAIARKCLGALCLFLSLAAGAARDEAGVRRTIADFVISFNNLDWPAFRRCWAADPVFFYPSLTFNATGKRIAGGEDFDSSWQRVFETLREDARKQGVTKPPFQHIEPRDVRIDFPGPGVAVVTFHAAPAERQIGRRTFVLSKTKAGWKITHMHASNLTLDDGR